MHQSIIADAIRAYAPFDGKDVVVQELSDGNINYVYRLKTDQTSVILKYAADHLRSSKRALDPKRNRIEADYYQTMTEAASYFPTVYDVDASQGYFLMEDLKDYASLSEVLRAGTKVPQCGSSMAEFCLTTIRQSQRIEKDIERFWHEELKDITRQLVFTEPYNNEKQRNQVTPGMEAFVQQTLYDDGQLAARARHLKQRFDRATDVLLHGDLHDRSVWAHGDSIKVLDPEFATWGPVGFDAGMFWGNLWMGYFYHVVQNHDAFAAWLLEEIKAFYREVVKENHPFLKEDIVSVAGLEMIRRTVGDARNPWIDTGIEEQLTLEKQIIHQGKAMVLQGAHWEGPID